MTKNEYLQELNKAFGDFIFFEEEYVDYATTFVSFLAIFFIFWAAQISHV